MAVDVTVKADDFLRLSKALKEAGHTGKGSLRNELNAGIRKAVKPAQKRAADELTEAMPGPLRARAGKVKQVTRIKTGADAGVTSGIAYGKRGAGLGASNARLASTRGLIRHPLYGNRERWFNTSVPGAKDWHRRSFVQQAPQIRRGIEQAMENVAAEVVRRARG